MRFSEKIGKKKPKTIQIESMDSELQNSLWNVFDLYVGIPVKEEYGYSMSSSRFYNLFRVIWFSFFKEPLDQLPSSRYEVIDEVRKRFFSWDYLDVYDFFDFLIQYEDLPLNKEEIINHINLVLKREVSGYQIVNGALAPIIHEIEISEVERALDSTNTKIYAGANIHLSEAQNKLADRKNPDYRNSIKESMCAIESMCQIISNNPKAELGVALKILKSKIPIHGALEQGFLKIYGYASDSDGIRHALLEESNVDQEDALFMLVASSAFVNYLIAKNEKVSKM